MKYQIIASMALCLPLICSCSGNKKAEQQIQPEKSKTLVLYYSQTGATHTVADELQQLLGAEIDSIVAAQSYGYDYDATIERWTKEREDSVKVAIKPLSRNINDYDTIYLGFPIWGGTYAAPVATFLADNSLEGKTVITFATFGSGGIESATKDVAGIQPKADVKEGYGVRSSRLAKSPQELKRFLISNGYMKGDITPLPEYGEATPVNEVEGEIFKEACGNYRFPLGTPVSVATRSYDGITDYRYDVKSETPEGKEINSVIYVVKEPDSIPVFTKVVRYPI